MRKSLACLLAACLLVPVLCLPAGAADPSSAGGGEPVRCVQFHDTLTLLPGEDAGGTYLAVASYGGDGRMVESALLPLAGTAPLSFRLARPDDAGRVSVFCLDPDMVPAGEIRVLEGDGLRLDGESYDGLFLETFRILAEYTKAHAVDVDRERQQYIYLRSINAQTTAYLVYEEGSDVLDTGSITIDGNNNSWTSLIRIPADGTTRFTGTVTIKNASNATIYSSEGGVAFSPSDLYSNGVLPLPWPGPESYYETVSTFFYRASLLALLQFDSDLLSRTPCSVSDLGFVNIKERLKTDAESAVLSGDLPLLPSGVGALSGAGAAELCALIREVLAGS